MTQKRPNPLPMLTGGSFFFPSDLSVAKFEALRNSLDMTCFPDGPRTVRASIAHKIFKPHTRTPSWPSSLNVSDSRLIIGHVNKLSPPFPASWVMDEAVADFNRSVSSLWMVLFTLTISSGSSSGSRQRADVRIGSRHSFCGVLDKVE